MKVKGIIDEDFVNYRKPSMYICSSICDFKCDRENGNSICQNGSLAKERNIQISDDKIIKRYQENPITKAIVLAGLEPFEQFDEVNSFIGKLRTTYHCDDTVVIYTGFNKAEISSQIETLRKYKNIIVKFGRFIPNEERHYDDVLGVYLASHNQYAEIIS